MAAFPVGAQTGVDFIGRGHDGLERRGLAHARASAQDGHGARHGGLHGGPLHVVELLKLVGGAERAVGALRLEHGPRRDLVEPLRDAEFGLLVDHERAAGLLRRGDRRSLVRRAGAVHDRGSRST